MPAIMQPILLMHAVICICVPPMACSAHLNSSPMQLPALNPIDWWLYASTAVIYHLLTLFYLPNISLCMHSALVFHTTVQKLHWFDSALGLSTTCKQSANMAIGSTLVDIKLETWQLKCGSGG